MFYICTRNSVNYSGMFSFFLTQSQGLFCLSPHPTHKAGGTQVAVRGHGHNSWPQLIQGIFQTTWHCAQHIELGEKEEREDAELWSSPTAVTHDEALLSCRWLNTSLPMGSGECIPCFALLVRVSFAISTKLSLFQPTSFLTSTPPALPITIPAASEQAATQGWVADQGWAWQTVTQTELSLVPNNSPENTTSPALSNHPNRWSPKSWTKGTQGTFMDILQTFHRGDP